MGGKSFQWPCLTTDDVWGEHDALAEGSIQLLCRFYEILNDESMFLSTSGKEDVAFIGNTLGNLYAQLATMCYVLEYKLWKMSPKLQAFS